jgi:hypothetical protein
MQQLIVFAIFGGFGLVMLAVGLRQLALQRRLLRDAQPVSAVITRASVHSSTSPDTDARTGRDNSTTTHRPELSFRYVCNGQTYESDLLRPTIIVRTYVSREAAAQELLPYPVGSQVIAHVDPACPARGFLVKEASRGPLVFTIIGVVLPPLAWWLGGIL